MPYRYDNFIVSRFRQTESNRLTAFKTMSMRIRGAKTELEEAGLETEGMVESTAKLRQEILALSGVDIMLNPNEFKSTYQIMEELADKWQDLTDIQQASVTELIAGKRQGNIVSSLMNNFDIAEQALETSLNSSGSAMKEHEKWQKSLEAQLLKLKAAWQSLSQSFLSSDFLKVALDFVIALVDGLDKLISTLGTIPTLGVGAGLWKTISSLLSVSKDAGGIKSISDIFKTLSTVFPNAAKGMSIFTASLKGGVGIVGVLKGALSGLWTVVASHPIMAVVAAVGLGIAAFAKWHESAEELAERIEGVTDNYREQHDSLLKLKDDYDTSIEDSMISKYGELSKGVNGLGENLSLTADEYAEYQSIVNTIAEQMPNLVTGYNSQGDAILSCAGSVDKLSESYRNLIKEQNKEVLETGSDIFKDFKNDLKETSAYFEKAIDTDGDNITDYIEKQFNTDHFDNLERLMNLSGDKLEEAVSNLSYDEYTRISDLLEEQGIERNVLGSGDAGWENYQEHIIRAITEDKKKIKSVLEEAKADLNAYAEELGTVTEAYFSTAFLGGDDGFGIGDYSHFSDKMQNIISQVTSNFDTEFYDDFLNLPEGKQYEALTKYFDDMLSAFNKLGSGNKANLEAAFDLQTKFNGGKISYGEYVKGIQEASGIIDSLGLDEEVVSQLKLSLNTDEVKKDYDALTKSLIDVSTKDLKKIGHFSGISEAVKLATEEAKEFLDGLTASEYAVAVDLIANDEIDLNNFNLDSLREYIEKQARINEAMSFTIAMDVETESIEALNTAMSESVSGAGLSSEAISALKGRYAELVSQGYDLSSMFEETSNGIHLNRKAVNELEQALASQKLSETQGNLDVLKDRYDELTEEIKSCTSAGERANLYAEQQQVAQKINDLATLAAQYEGLTSAYQTWQNVESAGSERDMYEGIIDGFETVKDEISRGWIDDGTIEFLKLIRGEKTTIIDADGVAKEIDIATASANELKQVWKDLDKNIEHTSYSVKDFFTVDEEGNSTSKGVYNFLDAIGQLEEEEFGGKDVVKRDKNGKIISFDFNVAGGDKAIADALGISEELVQIMQRAADDAGFVITLDGSYTQLADLKTSAEESENALKKLKSNGLDALKDFNDEDLDFNFGASSLEDLNTELEKATNVLDKFRKEDGTINMEMEGAEEALEIASYFTATIDKLTEPVYMQLETNQVENNLQEPLTKMQEFERLSKTKHQLQLTGDTEGLKETEEKMDEIAQWLENLDEDTKVELNIDGLSTDEIKDKLEKGEIEIPATVDIQLEMSEDIKDMRLLMMQQLGLVSKNEVKLKIGYEIDDSIVDKLEDDEQEIVVKYIEENEEVWNKLSEEEQEIVIEYVTKNKEKFDQLSDTDKKVFVNYIANGGDVEKFDAELENRNRNIEVVAETYGVKDVENLKSAMSSLTDEQVKAIAEAIGKGDVDALDSAIEGMDGNIVKAIAQALGYNDVESLKSAINSMQGNEVDAKVNTDGQKQKIDTFQSWIDGIRGKTVDVVINTFKNVIETVSSGGKSKAAQRTGADPDGKGTVNGTANVNGTTGRAFKQGSWGTKNSGTALVGELGRETIVRDGHYYTIGDNGAEFIKYQKGDIIFNHKQTEELFKNGRVTSGGGRAKALTSGTAFVDGIAFGSGSGGGIESEVKSIVVGTNSKTGKSYTKSKDNDDFEETFDWIETAISRVERAIDNLDKKASNIYKSWSSRNSALKSEISKVGEEINLQQKAYNEYMAAANGVGLSSSWASKVRNGTLDISTVKDEALADKISDYQKWYEKALDCQDAIEELKETEAKLYAQRIENVATQYEGILGVIEHEKNMIEEYISQSEANAQLISGEYYKALINNENKTVTQLQKQKNSMLAELKTAMESGSIAKGSEAWYSIINSIDEVTLSIAESQTQIKEWNQTIQQLSWETFDLLQDKISAVTEESDFLIELMSNDKLHDDNGKLTDEGSATMGLHGQNYNTYMYQADLVAKEAERLEKQMSADGYDTELEERYREMISLQQEYILNAEDEKNAIRDLVSDGIELELDALQELIDKKNEELESERDLYEYQKKVLEQTKEISSLEKQIASYSGDDSEEAKAKIQELKVSLEEAKADLEETEYDKYISDQSAMLDELYLEYETILNARLDNLDALVEQVVAQINMDATSINTTLSEKADSVGYKLSDSMTTIWDTNSTKINSVITTYGEKFTSAQTTTNNALNTINSNLQKMITQLNSMAKTNTKSASTSSAANSKEANAKKKTTTVTTKKPAATTNTPKSITVGGMVNASGAQIYDYAGDTSGERQLYRNDPKYKVLRTDGNWIQVRWHKLSSGVTGWFKKSDVSAYKTGKRNFSGDEIAWTQDGGKEFIVRPSDGAILTPIAKGDSVLNANASSNIWNMANTPSEFIRDNLNLGNTNIPNNSNVNNNITQNVNANLNFPNVKNYEEMLISLSRDPKFQKLVDAMTTDQYLGKSSLAKGKAIR